MKRVRLFFLTIALMLTMTVGASALTEYTHYSGAYGFTMPDEWFPITHGTISVYVENGLLPAAVKEVLFDATVGEPVTLLCEAGYVTQPFKNNIRIRLTDIDTPLSLEYYVTHYREATEERIMSTFPQAQMVIPLQLSTFGNNQAAVHAYSWTDSDGRQLTWMEVMLTYGTRVIRIGLECTLEEAARCGGVLEEVAGSFFVP